MGSEGHIKISELAKLKELMGFMKNVDPMTAENRFFSKIGCNSEKEKIDFEAKFLLSTLVSDPEKYKKVLPNYDETKGILLAIIKSIDDFRLKDIPIVKRYFIVLELRLGKPISFFSEVENVYNSNLERIKEEYSLDNKTKDAKDFVTEINNKDVLIESYKKINNNKNLKKEIDNNKNIDNTKNNKKKKEL